MKNIETYPNKECIKKFKDLGFVKYKKTFIRKKGDVIQAFTFKRHKFPTQWDVEFGIYPLCYGEVYDFEGGDYELYQFDVAQQLKFFGRSVFLKQDEKALLQRIDENLMPLFEKCYDCKSSLEEIIKFEELCDTTRKKLLEIIGTTDCAAPWQTRSLFDPKKFYMAMKSQNWSYVHKYLQLMVNHYKTSLEKFNNPNSTPKQPDDVIKNFEDGLLEMSERLEHIESKDYGYFEEIVNFNEKQMLEYIELNYPLILKS